jgi:hypothetical protein
MVRRAFSGIKRFILWDYPRASWQYDIMVGVILAFLFLTPREWFNDQPRVPTARKVAKLQGPHGANVFWIEAGQLVNTPESRRAGKALELIKAQTGENPATLRLEPVLDSEQAVTGYMAFTRP